MLGAVQRYVGYRRASVYGPDRCLLRNQVTVLSLFLTSPTLPAGKTISLDITNPEQLAAFKKNPINIKEGVDYNVGVTFKVNHGIITGVRYIQVVKRSGLKGGLYSKRISWRSCSFCYTR